MTVAPVFYSACQVSFFVCGLMALSVVVYLLWMEFDAPRPQLASASVPVAYGPYVVSRGRRMRRRDYLTLTRLNSDLHRMRVLQRQLSLRGVVV